MYVKLRNLKHYKLQANQEAMSLRIPFKGKENKCVVYAVRQGDFRYIQKSIQKVFIIAEQIFCINYLTKSIIK